MKTIKGDLVELFLQGTFDIIIHGCNCQKAMGAGIAAQIANKIPEAKFADDMYFVAGDSVNKLSSNSVALVRRNEWNRIGIVINLYTQYLPGRDLDENALLLGFKKLAHKIKITDNYKIGIPEIGCGIAGGDWSIIGPKIQKIMENHDITLVQYEPVNTLKNEINK